MILLFLDLGSTPSSSTIFCSKGIEMKKFFSILLILFSITQCFKAFSSDSTKQKSMFPIQDHFVFLNVHLSLDRKSNIECIKDKNCVLVSDITSNVSELNSTFINTPMLVGSGFVYRHEENKTLILTSNHVCRGINSYLKFQSLLTSSKEEILQSVSESKKYRNLDFIQIKGNYNLNAVVTLFDFNGNKYRDIKVKKQDRSKDLCIVESYNKIGQPVVFSENNCEYGEEIVNVSASDGNYFPNAVPYHIGAYSGSIKNKRFGLMGKGEDIALYTLDIEQGSSGSAVFSKKTKKVCGNINATMKKTNLTIGIASNGIKEFIR